MNASHASPKQAAFQAQYRDAIPVDYSGLRHGAIILAIGAVVLALCIWRIHAPVTALEWLVVPVVVVFSKRPALLNVPPPVVTFRASASEAIFQVPAARLLITEPYPNCV